MNEIIQAGKFYDNLQEKQKEDLAEVIAEDIFFLDDDLQAEILKLLNSVDVELHKEVMNRNDFTT